MGSISRLITSHDVSPAILVHRDALGHEYPETREADAVYLRVYDLSNNRIRSLSRLFAYRRRKKPINGLWHTSVVVFGSEYCFGQRGVVKLDPDESERIMGMTLLEDWYVTSIYVDQETLEDQLCDMHESTFEPGRYNMFYWNCHDFTESFLQWCRPRTYPYVPGYCRYQIEMIEDQGHGERAVVGCTKSVYSSFFKKKNVIPFDEKAILTRRLDTFRIEPVDESGEAWVSAESMEFSSLQSMDASSFDVLETPKISGRKKWPTRSQEGGISDRQAAISLERYFSGARDSPQYLWKPIPGPGGVHGLRSLGFADERPRSNIRFSFTPTC